MLKRTIALDFLTNLLWSMMGVLECRGEHTKEQCRGIILDVEFLVNTNKVQAIKDVRDWINNKERIDLPNNLGHVMKDALRETQNLYDFDVPYVMFEAPKRMGLKETKDFIDVMQRVLEKTEPKGF